MEKAAFKLDSYQFTKASLDFNISDGSELNIIFNPKGTFHSKKAQYDLAFDVIIESKETGKMVIEVSCVASFTFDGQVSIDDIPDYFYPNSLAILFPYIRAFISTISLQANVRPVLLPTINLVGLTEELKRQTKATE